MSIEQLQHTYDVKNKVNEVIDEVNIVTQVDSIDKLRNIVGTEGQQVSVASYYAGGTTGGGTFVWDADSAAVDDGGVTIAVTGVNTGRWVRQFSAIEIESISDKINNEINVGRPMELIAHRGFRNINTENTLYALKRAKQQGADSVECDIQWSADGVAYLFHDVTVDGLTTGTGVFKLLDSSYIDTLTFNQNAGTRFADMRITKVADMIAWLKKSGVYCYPEIKTYRTLADVYDMIALFKSNGLINKTMFQSFDINVVELMLLNDPKVKAGWLCAGTFAAMTGGADRLAQFRSRAALLINNVNLLASPAIVPYARDYGLDVGTWTVNSQTAADQCMAVGVYKIMSDIQLFRGKL